MPSSQPAFGVELPPDQQQRNDRLNDLLHEEAQRVGLNLGTYHVSTSRDLLPRDMETDKAHWRKKIRAFLTECPLHNPKKRRWVDIPDCPSHQHDLFRPFSDIISAVIDHQDAKDAPGSREVVVTHNELLPHAVEREEWPNVYSAPSIAVTATGPSFQPPRRQFVGYSNIAACIEVRTNDSDVDAEQEIYWLGIYAKQIFNQQPNREFVRCLLVTETHALLVHYDRAGAQWFPLIDIHNDPYTFLRVLFSLTSPNEATLGFDTSLQWCFRNGRKATGTIIVCNVDGKIEVYRLLKVDPMFTKHEIRGSGTRCWKVRDPKTHRELIIKATWVGSDGTNEAESLERAKGIPGVVQMVTRDTRHCQTNQFRGVPNEARHLALSRSAVRVVLEAYGKPVYLCDSEETMIAALRDAIVGHWRLLRAGLLHRDVSRNNVLVGKPNAMPGARGVLIDLDLATRMDEIISGAIKNSAVGTLAFQSIAVLRSRDSAIARRQIRDHLDDLESFFYVLCDTLFCWEENECPGWMWVWAGEEDPEEAAWGKLAFFYESEQMDLTGCDPHWGSASRNLIRSFFKFIREIVVMKEKLGRTTSLKKDKAARIALIQQRDLHYGKVVSFFDQALEELSDLLRPASNGDGSRRFRW